MTQDDIVERGIQAEAYLNDTAFMSFFQELQSLYMQNIVNTAPENWKERESLYKQFHAVTDVIGVMQSYVSAKDQIKAAQEIQDTD